jgi:hypothetical protein
MLLVDVPWEVPEMTATMAPPKKRKGMGRPKAEDPKRSLASLKGGERYAKWLAGLVDHSHLPVTILIEHALREYAERHGYTAPQPKR